MQSETNFAKCDRVFGEINIRADPPVQHFNNVIVDDWAVFDRSRRIIPESGYYRGIPTLSALRGAPFTGYHPARVRNSLPETPYFYLGHIAHHFGHFIVGTLSRLWPFRGNLPAGTPILYYGPPPAELFETEYVRACFDALTINQDQMIRIDGRTPLRVPHMIIADSGFYENFSISPIFIAMLKDIAAKVLTSSDIVVDTVNLRPVYVSKSQMKSGVRAIVNEAALDKELENLGIEVAHPERLSFAEQIAFWSAKRNFIAFSSSSLHMAAFAGNQSVAVIHYDGHANSNQMLLDVAAGNNALYIHPVSGLEKVEGNSEFGALHQLSDPSKMAKDIATVLAAIEGGYTKSVSTIQRNDHTLNPLVNVNDPLGFNIAATGIATQSSLYRHDEGCNRTAEGALSGRLTGRYQCHTDAEMAPWWQVELPMLYTIYEVRVYNRCDNPVARARLNRLVTLLSSDGSHWHKAAERHENSPAGGIDGYPYRLFLPPGTVARFIRLQTFGYDFLHFDQVEVFGETVESIWFKRNLG